MKAIRLIGQRAGCSAPDDDAVADLGRLQNLKLDQGQHALRVEDLVVGKAGHVVDVVVPEGLAIAVVPGVEALIVFGRQLLGNPGGAGSGAGQI